MLCSMTLLLTYFVQSILYLLISYPYLCSLSFSTGLCAFLFDLYVSFIFSIIHIAIIFSQSIGLDNYSRLAEKATLLFWGTYYPPPPSSACSKDPTTSTSLFNILQIFLSTPNLTFMFTSTWMVMVGLAVSWPPHLHTHYGQTTPPAIPQTIP